MPTRKDARKDEWDARLAPGKPRRVRGAGGDQGLVLMLLAIGIPLVAFFIQVDGAVRFSTADKVFERTLTVNEQKEIRAAIDKNKAKLDTMQRIVEDVKETYRGETGASYKRPISGSSTRRRAWPSRISTFSGLGALLFLIGLGKLFI